MGRNLYSQHDDDFIRYHINSKSNAELAEALGRSVVSIANRISKLKLTRESSFSEDDDDYLRKHHKEKTHAEMAKDLGKSKESICTRIKKLRLQKHKPRFTNKNGQPRVGYSFILYSDWATMLDTPCPVLAPCQRCKELNPITDFYQYKKRGKSGFVDVIGNNRHSICPRCGLANYIAKDERQKMLENAKSRAKRDGREFSLTIEDIVIPKRCPILGIELKAEVGSGRANSPSQNECSPQLDRIDSAKGYIPGNVCVVSAKANIQKKNGTAKEFLAITAFLIESEHITPASIKVHVPYAERSTRELVQIVSRYVKSRYP